MTTAVSSELQFEESTHTYTRNGVVIPGVTETLQSAGIIDTTWFTESAAWKGSRIHLACQFDDEGDIEESEFTEEELGYLEAWRKFKEKNKVDFTAIERPMGNDDYSGTPDRIVVIEKSRKSPTEAILDLKTGAIQPWVALQLAAYSELFIGIFCRIAVRLKPDGKYIVQEFPIHERRGDLNIFLAALAIRNWKESNR